MVDRLFEVGIILCIVIFHQCQSNSHFRKRGPVWKSASGNSEINPGGGPLSNFGNYIPAPTPKPIVQTRIVSSGEGSNRRVFISASGSGSSREALMEKMKKLLKEHQERIQRQGGNGKFVITSHTSHIGAPQVFLGPETVPMTPAPPKQPYKSSKPLTPSKFTPQEQATLLQYHNDVRQHLNPPPKIMERMQWSDVLAGKAQEYAERCEWQHSDKSGRRNKLGYRFVGENLYISTAYGVTKSVKSWADEKAYYDYWANTCVPGQQCGHYTQMIWATTNMVGCGIHFCRKVAFWRRGDAYYVVCNYGPGGNINGARPYEAKTGGNSRTNGSVKNNRDEGVSSNRWKSVSGTGKQQVVSGSGSSGNTVITRTKSRTSSRTSRRKSTRRRTRSRRRRRSPV
ncbi:GLIPR1-like protein 1 [Ylistrum balloti]|uniref:GLIPR1-like protein 1 n=1 Tax=Ylistrum balloti TaxID=509963 RepID=UPI002905D085|nr:GLIPR1-like protein 1 [Ylistrum balloti]